MARRGTLARINLVELEKLCMLQCTDEEIAAWFGVTTKTIERRRKVPKFAEVMQRGKAKGRISVRRMQMKMLEEGNSTMGVWLGKQLLGQTDQHHLEVTGQPTYILTGIGPFVPLEVGGPDEETATIDVTPRQASLPAPPE